TLTEDGDAEFAIDGTDRDIQRPKDNEKQKEFYNGRKKKHSVNLSKTLVSTRQIIITDGYHKTLPG
ncbi:transposase family protein, partial [Desulfococcaceae bacterium HSG8]|nr:transposase family protein [Desulfococcaceae bacterium HSG8]